jgi:kynurenine formamidase
MMMTSVPRELQDWPGHTGNWGRWPNDRGALNLITPEVTLRGTQSARIGRVISCARPIALEDPNNGEVIPASHEMVYVRDMDPEGKCNSAGDRIGFRTHGMINTHIDAFSHVGFKGYGWNGKRFADMVSLEQGATACDITDLLGIVTRGVFLDVARRRGITGLQPGDYVVPDDLGPILDVIQPGDAAVIRTGVTLTGGEVGRKNAEGKPDVHYPIAGFHGDCVDLLAEKGISVLASDSPSDAYPSPLREFCESPVHRLCLAFYGIPLLHNMDLEELGEACAAEGRDTFLFMVSPLNFPKATGSPCTPVAVL